MPDFIPRLLSGIFMLVLLLAGFVELSASASSLMLGGILLYILCVEWPQFKRPWLTPLYPVIPCLTIILLNQSNHRLELLWIALIICAHDSGAYFAGNIIGSHKIAPSVSPGKSWEGCLGGILISIITSYLILACAPQLSIASSLNHWQHILIVTLLNAAGICGDFFESYLKRSVNIKDSGTLLPGHGGVLDRLDSLLFAVPAWLIIRFFI